MMTITLEGGKELEARLLALELKTSRKIARSAVRDGGKIILAAAKSNAQSRVGGQMGSIISRALQLRAMKRQRAGQYAVQVRHSEKYNDRLVHITATGRRHYIPNAIEYGHAAPGDAGGAKTVEPRPYMRPAIDSNKAIAAAAIEHTVISGIEREFASVG